MKEAMDIAVITLIYCGSFTVLAMGVTMVGQMLLDLYRPSLLETLLKNVDIKVDAKEDTKPAATT